MIKSIFAQTEVYQKTVAAFEKNYNAEDYGKIFAGFSQEMQKALPLDKTMAFLSGLKAKVGKINSWAFAGFQKDTYASYKTVFEKATLSLNISVDNQAKINGLFIQPFVEKPKDSVNVFNALTGLPREQSSLLFARLKTLPNNAQVAIAFIENGKSGFCGIVKTNDTLKPIENKDKIFEIGSISKVFTATLLADLVIDKKINPEDPINKYYSFPFKNNTAIHFKSLANHTSGLPRLPSNFDPNSDNPYKNYDASKLNTYLQDSLKLQSDSGDKYAYSNLGAALLGYTLGMAQKSTYQQLLKKRIFQKYRMTSSFTDNTGLKDRLVKGLDASGQEVPNWDFDVFAGAGGILSSVNDLSLFAMAQFNPSDKPLALTRIPTFTVNENLQIGLGWHIIKTASGKELFWHNGGTGGYSSSLAIDTMAQNGIIILSNVGEVNESIDSLCFALMETLVKKQ